jgi:hypothetical protein
MDHRSEMAATTQLLLKGESAEAIDRLQRLFDVAMQDTNTTWVGLLGRHLSTLYEHERMNVRAVETLRAAISVAPMDPTLHYALARFEEREPALDLLQRALSLPGEDAENWKSPYLRELIEREIQRRK